MVKKNKRPSSIGQISSTTLGEFSQKSMHTYGTFVLLDRAVADVRDGLKPVQRRILWAMHALQKQGVGFKKSAKIVGDTIGSYHPHGDQAVYETLVNMVWGRYPLVEGHGNFGSPTDNAAAYRYTEARLSPLAEALFSDIDVAELVPNYSGDKQEPLVLPSRLPLLLLNGSSGIGVGIRTSIPPHNLRELLKVLIYFLTKENPNLDTIVKHLPGPDYGYGVLLSPPEAVRSLYETGSGVLQFRCEYEFETTKNGTTLLVKSLAPGFNMSSFLGKMRKLAEESLIDFCSDSTNAEGIRIYVGFKDSTVIKERVLPELYTSQSYQFYVVKRTSDDESEIGDNNLFSGGLFRLLQEFIDFRRGVERSRIIRELKGLKEQLLKAKALLAAIQNLDKVLEVLKDSHSSLESIRATLASLLEITDSQAQMLLEMRVYQLARMNESTQVTKIASIRSDISRLKIDLDDIDGVIVRHLKEFLKFTDDRKTKLADATPIPVLDVDDSEKYVLIQGSKISRIEKEPTRRHKFDLLTKATSSVVAVLANNEAKTFSLSYLTEDSLGHNLAGLVSDTSKILAAVDQDGLLVTLTPPSRPSFNVVRGATQLLSAVGVEEAGYLVLISTTGRGRILHFSSLEPSRAFVLGKKFFPTPEYGNSKDKVTRLLSVPPGADLLDSKGNSLLGNEYFQSKSLFVVGNKNFVLVNDDRRDIVDRSGAVSLLKKGELKECWTL